MKHLRMTARVAAILAVLALPMAAPAARDFGDPPTPKPGAPLACPIKLSPDIGGPDPSTQHGAGAFLGPKACRYALPENGSPPNPEAAEYVQQCAARENDARFKLDNGAWTAADPKRRCACYQQAVRTRRAQKFDNLPYGSTVKTVSYLSFDKLLACLSAPVPAAAAPKPK